MCTQNHAAETFDPSTDTFGPIEGQRELTPEERALRIVAIQRELEQLHADSRQPLEELRRLQAHLRSVEERNADLRRELRDIACDTGPLGFDSFVEGWWTRA